MRRAFALIYVLVIMMIMMLFITSVLSLGLSGLRQKNKVLATAGAYQMAQSGLEDGIANYQKDITNCGKQGFYNVKNGTYNAKIRVESPRTNDPATDDQGDYAFTIACSPVSITAIGYSKGSKVKMRADMEADNTKWNIYQVGF